MENSVISFPCPVCAIKLTVPAHLAGVVGPCPSCGSQIQAVDSPQSLQPVPLDGPSISAPPAKPSVAAGRVPVPPKSSVPVIPRPVAPPQALPPPEPRPPQVIGRFKRVLFLVLLVLALVTIGTGMVSFLQVQSEKQRSKHPVLKVPVSPIPPKNVTFPVPTETKKLPLSPVLELPVLTPAPPVVADPEPSPAKPAEVLTPSQTATKVLGQFLAAQTLAERLALGVTQTPEPILAKSCLAGPLPTAKEIFIEAIETNAAEQVVNFYHQVTFEGKQPGKKSQTILVQQRGSGEPKVVVDPFLDSFGGRLATYAKTPSDQPATFQVTMIPLATCSEKNVPNRGGKLTLKLLPHDDAKEIALAFFGKQSKIAQTLEDGTYSLSYGKAKACTVVLRWNREERPETPYLEAVALKALDWNP